MEGVGENPEEKGIVMEREMALVGVDGHREEFSNAVALLPSGWCGSVRCEGGREGAPGEREGQMKRRETFNDGVR